MTRAELLAFLPATDNCPTLLGGSSFAVPTLRWLQGTFWQLFHARLWDTNNDKWKVRWACRDFARRYASLAQECWADTTGGTDDDSIAVGEIWFLPDNRPLANEGHAVCPIFVDGGLKFIDPQSNLLWPMSPTELASRYMVRF